MTAIHGLIRFDGRPVTSDELRAMREPMTYWGPDGGGVWHEGMAGIGQLVAHNTPESMHERGPLVLASGAVLVAAARLDNHDQLRDELRERNATTASELIAAAWERWGEEAPQRLYGDWAFAVWNPARRTLFLARDQFGTTALYYHRTAETFTFATSLKGLLALPHVPRRLNELRFAQHLVAWIADGAATMREEIYRLPAGHVLRASDAALKVDRYWWPEELPEVRLSTDEAYVERFLELYDAAVRARVRTIRPVATTLSSGLDSGSVTTLAARELRAQGKMLTAFTSVPRFPEVAALNPRVVVDEWPLAHMVAQQWPNVDHRSLPAADVTPLQAWERSLWIHDEPEFSTGNLHWIIALLEECRTLGAGVMLTGQVGNGGVSWAGEAHRARRLLLTGHPIQSLRAVGEWKRNRRTDWPRALWSQILLPLRGAFRGVAFRRGWSNRALWLEQINPRFAERLQLVERVRESRYDPTWTKRDIRSQRLAILLPGLTPLGALWHETGAAYGLEVRDPTADVRLLEFCLGVPDDQFTRGDRDRWLIRRSMEGLLPAEVQWNVHRGAQGIDLPLRLLADASNVTAAVDAVAASARAQEYLNIEAMRGAWATIQRGLDRRSINPAMLLARMLHIGMFLRRFDAPS